MAKFTVKAGSGLNFDFPARYLLIDSITAGKSLRLRSVDSDLDIDLTVRGGGKIQQMPELVSRWRFDNENTMDVDVVIQGGSVFYDENRLDGDVNAITRFDNLTLDGNQFVVGNSTPASANNAFVGLYNPVGSGVKASVNAIVFSSFGIDVAVYAGAGKGGALVGSVLNNKLIGGAKSKCRQFAYALPINVGGFDRFGSYPTDVNGTSINVDFKNRPFVIGEDETFVLYCVTANNKLTASIEFSEL